MTLTQATPIQLADTAAKPTPKTPKIIIDPWRALESGATLEVTSVQTQTKLVLVPTATTRGTVDNRWTYPGLGVITDDNLDDLYEKVMLFRSEKWQQEAVVTAFDKECQDAWKNTEDEDKFATAISDESIQRTPKRWSTHYLKLANELRKEIKDKQAGKITDEQKKLLNTYLLEYKKAIDAETDAEMAELLK